LGMKGVRLEIAGGQARLLYDQDLDLHLQI